jgi:fluoride exporter
MPIPLSVAVFGALGALTRYGVDRLIERHTFSIFPLSTLAVNLSGCVLAGAAVGGLVDRLHEPTWLTFGIVTGFLGAYTTFSAFAYETHDLLQSSHLALALLNAVVSVAAGVGGVYVGLVCVKR